ncbi:MAG TPA: flagellar filament outer layer protein FlaA [Spirochaetota bacterium]|nr:flagellar filament outer layer protein FlaA [Spirochaetota bacterium]HPC42971.1 flagellar filament outer layer protein FlaA [Spirochaetota bacterium]HPL18965.1 flagellar filament outer layer protein FlaA [Spirochaetota bacterium]HQF10070.1 flagellar filament outer layer protein FlaA [Spirochaetota bacterium]HQH98810.1 flagellar filament outer layer protein FlaA [Spirochaetota bacterium]
MFKKIIVAIAALAFVAPLYSQEKGKESEVKKPAGNVVTWQEIVLEDFETTPYTNKNVSFRVSSDQDASIQIRDNLPATSSSKKYLGLKVKTRGNDSFVIKPAKDIVIDKFCKSISFWVYGGKTHGEVSFILQDTEKNNHRLVVVPVINFVGWKQFTVPLTGKVAQEKDFLNQKKIMKILNIQYRTVGNREIQKPATWEYVYFDDITATVREPRAGKQDDQW